MSVEKKTGSKDSEIIRASEIGQYHYCSISWYLQKCGFKPRSSSLEVGRKKHIELGKIMDKTNVYIKWSRTLAFVGYFLLILGLSIFIFEVIL